MHWPVAGIARVAVVRPAEFDHARAHRRDDRDLIGQFGRHHALVVGPAAVGRGQGDPGHVHALDRADDAELQHSAEYRVDDIALQGLRQRHRPVGLVAAGLLQDVDEVQSVADAEPREVDDDVVALGDALLVELGQQDRVDHQVAVVGDELEGHRRPGRTGDGKLEEARHAGIEDAEAVLPRQHLHERRISEIDQR